MKYNTSHRYSINSKLFQLEIYSYWNPTNQMDIMIYFLSQPPWVMPQGVEDNGLDCDTGVSSSKSSHTITFTWERHELTYPPGMD